jgi:hypothetical protein
MLFNVSKDEYLELTLKKKRVNESLKLSILGIE